MPRPHARWRGQFHLGNDPRPVDASMHPKPVERLTCRMIFAKAGIAFETRTAIRSSKVSDRHGKAVNNSNAGIIGEQFVPNGAPQSLFDDPQIGSLSYKRRAMQFFKSRKEVASMPTKVFKESLVLAFVQVHANDFHRHHLAIGEFGFRSSLPQSLSCGHARHYLVNQTKTCDNKVVQVHESPHNRLYH